LLNRTIHENEDGTFTQLWKSSRVTWAGITPLTGREAYGEGWENLHGQAGKYKVVLRFQPEKFMRIEWGKIMLALLCAPLYDHRRQWTTCLTYEVLEEK
jgi:head-tail adaptor